MPPTYIHIKTITAMKQKLQHQSLIVTLVTMLLLLAGSSASAQGIRDLRIVGVEVNSANCSDLSVIDGVTGEVRYNPTTKTLLDVYKRQAQAYRIGRDRILGGA